jgi:proteasome accessory factor C
MDKFDRIFQLHAILSTRRTAIPLEDLIARLECSKSTLFRVIAEMKDYLHAPILFDTAAGGYRYDTTQRAFAYELPGLWFSPREIQALAVMQRLVHDIGGGLLKEHFSPLAARLSELTRHRRLNLGEAATRLRFPAIAARPVGDAFQEVTGATLQRNKLWFEYHARGSDERTERTVSPQRVTQYRESWYLDAWDEGKDALRTFSIDRIGRPTVLPEAALDVPEPELDRHYSSAYGIFGGEAEKVAVLHFTPERARWIADEEWHPGQQRTFLQDGIYELRIPYRDPRELVMDILRHGPHVKVISPPTLVEEVMTAHRAALDRYAPDAG